MSDKKQLIFSYVTPLVGIKEVNFSNWKNLGTK